MDKIRNRRVFPYKKASEMEAGLFCRRDRQERYLIFMEKLPFIVGWKRQ